MKITYQWSTSEGVMEVVLEVVDEEEGGQVREREGAGERKGVCSQERERERERELE